MYKALATVFLVCIFIAKAAAQNEGSIAQLGCGTTTTPEEMKAIYNRAPLPPLRRTAGVPDSIPLTIHIVGKTDGSGYYQLETLFRMLCRLNEKFVDAGLHFYVQWPLRYINNSSYYEHTFTVGANMMRLNNVANTVNVYFVNDPEGTCGYYSPSGQALAIKKSCAGINSTTLTHELGHYFGLPHTFFGWEDGETPLNPEKVTRGTGRNCETAGDGFCDTDADYLADRWSCPYTGTKLDVNGERYHPDSSLYMSYATDACMKRFSAQQISWMRGTLETGRLKNLLNSDAPTYAELGVPNMLYPADTVHTNFRYLVWNNLPGAEAYHIRITRSVATTTLFETVTSDTLVALPFNMEDGESYNVKMWAMSGVNVCRNTLLNKNFVFTNNNTDITLQDFATAAPGIKIYPNPANTEVNVFIDFVPDGNYQLVITDIRGKKVYQQSIAHKNNTATLINTRALPNGLYFIQVIGGGMHVKQKLLVVH
jgi:Pregnancy-associated plasma protein-A.